MKHKLTVRAIMYNHTEFALMLKEVRPMRMHFFAVFFVLLILLGGCSAKTELQRGQIIDTFIEVEKYDVEYLHSIRYKSNKIKIIGPKPMVVGYVKLLSSSENITVRILRKIDDPIYDYEALYPHTAYREYEIGEIITGELRGEKLYDTPTHHRFVKRDGNIIKLAFSDPKTEYITTDHSKFISTFIKVKIIEKVDNNDFDYIGLYLGTITP